MVVATAERTATVAIGPMTRSADGAAMMRAMSAATDTTDGHLLVGIDPDLLLRAIDTTGTGVSVSVSAMTMSAVVTTVTTVTAVIAGVMIPDLVGMTGIVAETVATIKTRQTRTLVTRTAMTDVIGAVKAVKVTARHVDTLDPLARLETAMNVLLPPGTVAETSPAVSSVPGRTLAATMVHLLLVPQPTSLIPRRSRKNDAVNWQRCNPMPLIWR
jgi:hypothetical protein